ncbi:MAG: DUF2889 domain-containing protein [Acidimicrobiales bacterium]|nr:DUF2889 domain-containing protein [Acidimicrobiales bacterium]
MAIRPAPLVPGPRRPLVDGGDLPAGGVRRTTTIDTLRPIDPPGPAVLALSGRDVALDAAGTVVHAGTADFSAEVDTTGVVTSIAGDLPDHLLRPLVGASVRAGFGGLVARSIPNEMEHRTLAASLLEDLSGGYFVSGTVLLWAGENAIDDAGLELVSDMQGDVCAGWRRDGQQFTHLAENLEIASPSGAPAPDLAATAGSVGWHEVDSLAPHTHRRARRLDLVPTHDGLRLSAHFRDSVADGDSELVLHEYRVDAGVDPEGKVTAVTVAALVLPWAECPAAVASAQRVVGERLADLPTFMRRGLVGAETCTHLNTTLRALADAIALDEVRQALS